MGNKNLVKYICCYDAERCYCLDITKNGIDESTVYSLKKLFPNNRELKTHGNCTNYSGEGTLNESKIEHWILTISQHRFTLLRPFPTGLRNVIFALIKDTLMEMVSF